MREFPKFKEPIKDQICVSETFYSIQGEGKFIGTPAVFLRTQGCLLNCEWCDTYKVWKGGDYFTYPELLNLWKGNGVLQSLLKPESHLILTGGEPLARQTELSGFVEYLISESGARNHDFWNKIEIETAGTVLPGKTFLEGLYVHYNVSPKLHNSGMSMLRRNHVDPMNYFSTISWEIGNYNISAYRGVHKGGDGPDMYEFVEGYSPASCSFKFVVRNREDIEEAFLDYINPYDINTKSIYLMTEAVSREQLNEREPEIVDLAKEFGLKYSTRLHLHIWDKATGV